MVSSSTILKDTIFFIKDDLTGQVTDPISRPTNQRFIMTSYPTRRTQYPLITIKDISMDSIPLGLRAEDQFVTITLEIRCWGRTTKERDEMAQEVLQRLRTNQIGSSGTSQANDLHDFQLTSQINIDEDDGPKSKVMQVQYIFIAT